MPVETIRKGRGAGLLVMCALLMLSWVLPANADPKLPDPEHALSDPAVEAIVGFLFSQEYEKKYIGKNESILPADAPETQYVRRVTDRLIRVVKTDRPDLVFEVKVVKGNDVNAICIPGGHIYVYTGLLDFIKQKFPADEQEDVLASAVGHEMAHAVLRHTLQTWSRAQDYKQVLTDKVVYKKLVLTTSRAMELEADRYGALYMLRANYKISAALDLFTKLPGSGSSESTHPTGAQRVAQLKTYVEQLNGIVDLWNEGLKSANAQNHAQARMCFTALRSEFPQLASVHNNLGWTLFALYEESIPEGKRAAQQVTYSYIPTLGVTLRGGVRSTGDPALLQASLDSFGEAVKLNPSLLASIEGQAACALEQGNVQLAAELLQKANKIAAKDASVANLWGVLRERQGNVSAALVSYDQAAKLDTRYLPALYNLACAYERQGKKSQAGQLFTRYVAVDSSGYWANMARQHMEHLGLKVPAVAKTDGPKRVSSAAGVKLGATAREVLKELGEPQSRQLLPTGGEVYHYKNGVDVYLSPSGVRAVNVTAAAEVAGVKVGMPADQLDSALGQPQSTRDGDNGEQLWNYPSRGLVVGVRDARVSSITIQR